MRRSFFAVLLFASFSSFPVLADTIQVDSKIHAATVYSDRATLTRRARIPIPAGAHNLVFKGLPLNLYPDSLRVEGTSSATVTFGAVTHKIESSADFVVPREKELNAALLTLQDQNSLNKAEKSALETGQGFLQSLGKQAALRANEEIAEIDLNPEEWGNAADALSQKMMENLKSAHLVNVKIRETNEKIQQVQNELNQLRTGQKQSHTVNIPYEANRNTTLTIDLSYQLPEVSWQPIYDARLDMKTGEMDLVQYGSVWQRTGEDWTNIDLTLSTAQPSRGTSLPDLYTQWVSIFDQAKLKGRAMKLSAVTANTTGMGAAPMASMDAMESNFAGDVAERKAEFQAAQIKTDGYVGEYNIPGPATVKSDGTKAKVLIGSFDTENWRQVQIKPQYSTDAFLVVKTKLNSEAPILPGQVNLFRDGAYIGQSFLPMLRSGDTQELAFGIDDNVTVKRNTLKNENSESGLIAKESAVEKHFVTEIQNLHKDPIEVAVLETIPVAQDERIKVEILKDRTTQGYESDLKDVKGLTRWRTTLKPQEKTKITLGWKVSWPKGENISGL